MMEDSKPFWASRTLWANAIALLALVALRFGIDLGLDADTQAEILVGVMVFVNVALRLDTSKAVTVKSL